MKPEIYLQFALRTLPPEHAFWNFDGDQALQAKKLLLTNAALGLAGEAAEVVENPNSDECGDAYWYAYVLMQGLEIFPLIPESADSNDDPATRPTRLMQLACTICELIKKFVFHNKSLDTLRPKIVRALQEYVNIIDAIDPSDHEATFQQNIDKLKARYPEGFKSLDIS